MHVQSPLIKSTPCLPSTPLFKPYRLRLSLPCRKRSPNSKPTFKTPSPNPKSSSSQSHRHRPKRPVPLALAPTPPPRPHPMHLKSPPPPPAPHRRLKNTPPCRRNGANRSSSRRRIIPWAWPCSSSRARTAEVRGLRGEACTRGWGSIGGRRVWRGSFPSR